MIGTTISHYKIIEKLGEGGMGVVYRAHDTTLDRDVALKFLPRDVSSSPEERGRFIHEAKAAASLTHPNIAVVHEIGEHPRSDGHGTDVFIAMEYIEGKTIVGAIHESPLPLNTVIPIIIQIAEGLNAAHEKGIVHRDIKSSNIIVTDKGQVKILDFGLAHKSGLSRLTKTGSTVGTAAYMSPEQARGEKLDHRTDLWSLGVVLYEMVTGKLPFGGDHEPAILYSVVNEQPQPVEAFVPDASPELVHIVRRALEKEPSERYQSAADMLIDLRRLKKDTSRTGFAPLASGRMRSIVRRRRTTILAALFVLTLAIGYMVFYPRTVELSPKRIGVTVFENLTGDPSLNAWGALMAEHVTQGLAGLDSFETVPSDVAIREWDNLKSRSQASEVDDALRSFAEKIGVGIVVSGRYYREGDTLRIRASVTDAVRGKLLRIVGPVSGTTSNRGPVFDEMRDRIMGGLTTYHDWTLHWYLDIPAFTPRYQAHREFNLGTHYVGNGQHNDAIDHYGRSFKMDSLMRFALIQEAYEHSNIGDNHSADSTLKILEGMRLILTKGEILETEYLRADLKGDIMTAYSRAKEAFQHWPRGWGWIYSIYSERINHFREAITANSKFDSTIFDPSTRGPMVDSYHGLSEYDNELREARGMRAGDPSMLVLFYYEMRALIASGRLKEFWALYDQASAITPREEYNQADLLLACAKELLVHGQRKDGVEAAERAVIWCLGRPDTIRETLRNQTVLADAYYVAGQWDRAKEIYQSLHRKDPSNIAAIGYLGLIAARTGDRVGAMAFSRALANIRKPYTFGLHTRDRAKIASLLGDKETAVALIHESISQGQTYCSLHDAIDFEPLKEYPPFQELVKPKE